MALCTAGAAEEQAVGDVQPRNPAKIGHITCCNIFIGCAANFTSAKPREARGKKGKKTSPMCLRRMLWATVLKGYVLMTWKPQLA
jgi:hypothetical protein